MTTTKAASDSIDKYVSCLDMAVAERAKELKTKDIPSVARETRNVCLKQKVMAVQAFIAEYPTWLDKMYPVSELGPDGDALRGALRTVEAFDADVEWKLFENDNVLKVPAKQNAPDK